MNILYVSTLCSDEKFKEIFENSSVKPQQQAQKFHSLLSKGLINTAESVYVMSYLPINSSKDKKVCLSNDKDTKNNFTYHYLKVINYPILKHLSIFIMGLINGIIWCYKKNNRIELLYAIY